MATPIQTAASDRVRREIKPLTSADPDESNQESGYHRRDVFGSGVSREPQPGNGRERRPRGVVPDKDGGERHEEQAFGQAGGRGEGGCPGAEGKADAANQAARNEQRPAFNVDRTDERRKDQRAGSEPDS